MPAVDNFDLWIGNTFSRTWRFPEGFDVTGAAWVFYVKQDDPIIKACTVDGAARTVTATLTVAQSRTFRDGQKYKYELEQQATGGGEPQTTYVYGRITGRGGNNDD